MAVLVLSRDISYVRRIWVEDVDALATDVTLQAAWRRAHVASKAVGVHETVEFLAIPSSHVADVPVKRNRKEENV